MGKASRNKHLKRQQAANLEQYGGVKLSEALINISEPYSYEELSLDDYKKLIMMTIAAWNIANHPEEKRAEQLLGFLKSLRGLKDEMDLDLEAALNDPDNPPASIAMVQVIYALMRRKLELYPNDNRIITDFKFTGTANDGHLSVSSIIPSRQIH
ncbi:MAG: hypothetical protein PHH11_11445 [Methylomonas sp.]|nr:hypothetical protein [Methylomonas sp.]